MLSDTQFIFYTKGLTILISIEWIRVIFCFLCYHMKFSMFSGCVNRLYKRKC